MTNIRIFLVAAYLTASFRLLPLPLSDSLNAVVLAVLVFLAGMDRKLMLPVAFFRLISPLLICFAVAIMIDVAAGRTGVHFLRSWIKILAGLMVANTVFHFGLKDLRRLMLVFAGLLAFQWAYIVFLPGQFIAAARRIGIVDTFVTYGGSLNRMYYAYFNANAAAYSIYYAMLAWIALNTRISRSKFEYLGVILLFAVMQLVTGGRGVLLLGVALLVAWLLSFRSTGSMVFVALASVGGFIFLPIYNAVVAVIFLREESNDARLQAQAAYLELIQGSPLIGIGLQGARDRVSSLGVKPSHNFFIEMVATFGIFLGGFFLLFLIFKMVVRPTSIQLKLLGFFGLASGFLNNVLHTSWTFLPLLLPVIMKMTLEEMRERRMAAGVPTEPVKPRARRI
ncbi:hypothetical protein KUW09_10745 [Mameliella alba]|nr:hypothetical protein [Antarctobacter heliothermus]MBY6144522.1 hypothetical protein [Mameliella alba]MCA0956222.1 hypothetical protein [Mameliella alba]